MFIRLFRGSVSSDRSLAGFLFEGFSRDLLAGLDSGGGSLIGNVLSKILLQHSLLHEISLLALLLETRAVELAHNESNCLLHDEVKVFREKNGEE